MCDQATDNVMALNIIGAPLEGQEESQCLTVGFGKISVVFDVLHLIKSIRNNLFKHGLKVFAAKPNEQFCAY